MSQDSIRVMETKERIRDAFFELYNTKKIEKISIKEITDKAQLNRGTFYVYYKDIYDLLEKSEDELIGELVVKVKEIITRIIRDESIEPFLPPMEFYQNYSKFLRVLLGENGDPKFTYKMKTILKRTLRDLLKKENIPNVKNMEYIMEYISSAQIGIISFWLNNDMALPIKELGNMIKTITLHGPVGYLKMNIDM
jgi:AcrR family transcriptional regulator